MIKIMSFSYKNPPDLTGYVVYDCRPLPNPHFHLALRKLDGRDSNVQMWLSTQDQSGVDYRLYRASQWAELGANIAFGCFGGKHRSVALAEMLNAELPAHVEREVIHTSLK